MRYNNVQLTHAVLPVERFTNFNALYFVPNIIPNGVYIINTQIKLHFANIAGAKQVNRLVILKQNDVIILKHVWRKAKQICKESRCFSQVEGWNHGANLAGFVHSS
jgi:hypothetical protein